MQKLTVSPSPHITDGASTSKIMINVMAALCPALFVSAYVFGGRALMLTGFCMLTAIVWERLCNIIMKKPNTTGDLSAAVTGMILAFNLPVTLPYWIAAIGTFVAIVVVKQLFGGLGQNFANPAAVARIVLMLSFTGSMTKWAIPFYDPDKIVTQATPIATRAETYLDLFIGRTGGSLGETSVAALLLGGIYLVIMKIITPHAPLAFIGTVYVFSWIFDQDPLYQILSGGLMLGAIFMATDYVTTPISGIGKVIFGVGCGIITCVIRFWGSYPEGVSYSLLLMNIITPYIDMAFTAKPFGAVIPEAEEDGK
ncbi:MAG: RnfABCDGE type electron transport complex subunit D [Ruminococcus sp.]|nr:RnfABCDGE type electron transport complex subunit D [Ruminococcus sp.]